MQWLNAHHAHSPITRHALVVLESIDAVDLAFDTFACALLDGEIDTSGYPEYNAIVGGVASHWDEATGDMICRAVVGWGGRGVRGDTDRIGAKLLVGHPHQHPGQPVRAGHRRRSSARCRPPGAAASSVRTAGSRRRTSGRSTARSAACACCAAEPRRSGSMPLYDYDCANCGRRFEAIHGVHADGPTACPLCGGGPVRKAITAAAVHFKGSGWAKKERGATARRRHRRRHPRGHRRQRRAAAPPTATAAASGAPTKAPVKTEAATETGTTASTSD